MRQSSDWKFSNCRININICDPEILARLEHRPTRSNEKDIAYAHYRYNINRPVGNITYTAAITAMLCLCQIALTEPITLHGSFKLREVATLKKESLIRAAFKPMF